MVTTMDKQKNISVPVIKRLPRYYRFLGELRDNSVVRISSRELSDRMGLTASQIRQDLNCFGGFGQQGYGYSVESLHKEIGRILGLDKTYNAVLIGAGNLGKAVALHIYYQKTGIRLIGIFDNDSEKIGTNINGLEVADVSSLEDFILANRTDVAVFCIPKSAAPETADRLHALGVKSYWNFSHYDFSGRYDDVVVENVHLNDSLMVLCYKMQNEKPE